MRYVAGWDGGGTKTAVQYMDLNGNWIGRAAFGPLNLNGSSKELVRNTVREALAHMAGMPEGLSSCAYLLIGTAGMSNPAARTLLCDTLREEGYTGAYQMVGDHETMLYGAVGGFGAVLVSGTGSVALGRNSLGETCRCGGWGNKIDDEGSGYAIGRDILTALVRSHDGRGPATCLTSQVYEALEIASPEELIRFVYDPATDKARIAALAPLLIPALEQQDTAAGAIAVKAASELVLLARTVIDRLGLEAGEIALSGSILSQFEDIRQKVEAGLAEQYPGLQVIKPRQDAAMGAALMALEAARSRTVVARG